MTSLGRLVMMYPELDIFLQTGAKLNMVDSMNSIADRVPPRSAVMMLVFMFFYPTCKLFTRESICTCPNNANVPEFWSAVRLADCCLESKLAYDGLQAYAPSEGFRESFILMGTYTDIPKSEICSRVERMTRVLENRYHWIAQGHTFVNTELILMHEKAVLAGQANPCTYVQ